MSAILDFVSGRSNKLLRDILAASFVTVLACVGAVTVVQTATDRLMVARQPLPPRLEANRTPNNAPIVTVTRSVLDDPIITGSATGRNLVLDPCTGREKK